MKIMLINSFLGLCAAVGLSMGFTTNENEVKPQQKITVTMGEEPCCESILLTVPPTLTFITNPQIMCPPNTTTSSNQNCGIPAAIELLNDYVALENEYKNETNEIILQAYLDCIACVLLTEDCAFCETASIAALQAKLQKVAGTYQAAIDAELAEATAQTIRACCIPVPPPPPSNTITIISNIEKLEPQQKVMETVGGECCVFDIANYPAPPIPSFQCFLVCEEEVPGCYAAKEAKYYGDAAIILADMQSSMQRAIDQIEQECQFCFIIVGNCPDCRAAALADLQSIHILLWGAAQTKMQKLMEDYCAEIYAECCLD